MNKQTKTEPEDKLASAMAQGRAQFDSIKEMVEALERANESAWENPPTPFGNFDEANEAARRTIEEDALSVRVRDDWHAPWASEKEECRPKATEYEILLCTGGPACRIVGTLSEYCEPETALIEVQDWFTPWTPLPIGETGEERMAAEKILLTYASVFYFGE